MTKRLEPIWKPCWLCEGDGGWLVAGLKRWCQCLHCNGVGVILVGEREVVQQEEST